MPRIRGALPFMLVPINIRFHTSYLVAQGSLTLTVLVYHRAELQRYEAPPFDEQFCISHTPAEETYQMLGVLAVFL